MALADSYEELEAHLDAAYDAPAEAVESGMFRITDAHKADWAVRKIAQHRRRLAADELVATAEIERITEWIQDQRARCTSDTAFLEQLLEDYHRQTLEADPKAKTIRLPAGTLEARKQPDRWVIDDELFLPWAKDHHTDLLRVKVEIDRPAVKKKLQAIGNGHAADPETSELAPGITIEPGDVGFKVKTEADQ